MVSRRGAAHACAVPRADSDCRPGDFWAWVTVRSASEHPSAHQQQHKPRAQHTVRIIN